MTKPLDLTKPVMLSDGTPVTILDEHFRDGEHRDHIILVKFDSHVGHDLSRTYRPDGTSARGHVPLVNKPTKRTGWVNLYRVQDGRPHIGTELFETEHEALTRHNRIATAKFEWEE